MINKFIKLFLIVFAAMIQIVSYAQRTNNKHVHVNGYYRSNGTYVQPHYRTAPNSTNTDNFSTQGNINPYTGKLGTVLPNGVTPSIIGSMTPHTGNISTGLPAGFTLSTVGSITGQDLFRQLGIGNQSGIDLLADFNRENVEMEKKKELEEKRIYEEQIEQWRKQGAAQEWLKKMRKAGYVSVSDGYEFAVDKKNQECINFHDRYSEIDKIRIKKWLSQLGYELLSVNDDSFDALTIIAIKEFQESEGLHVDGKIGQVTLNRLTKKIAISLKLSTDYFLGKWKVVETTLLEFKENGVLNLELTLENLKMSGTWYFRDNMLIWSIKDQTFTYKIFEYSQNYYGYKILGIEAEVFGARRIE